MKRSSSSSMNCGLCRIYSPKFYSCFMGLWVGIGLIRFCNYKGASVWLRISRRLVRWHAPALNLRASTFSQPVVIPIAMMEWMGGGIWWRYSGFLKILSIEQTVVWFLNLLLFSIYFIFSIELQNHLEFSISILQTVLLARMMKIIISVYAFRRFSICCSSGWIVRFLCSLWTASVFPFPFILSFLLTWRPCWPDCRLVKGHFYLTCSIASLSDFCFVIFRVLSFLI